MKNAILSEEIKWMKDVGLICDGIRRFPLYGDAGPPLLTGVSANAGENSMGKEKVVLSLDPEA